MAKIKDSKTVKEMRILLDAYKTVCGEDYTEQELFCTHLLHDGGKLSCKMHIFETTAKNGVYTYYIVMDGNKSYYLMGRSKEEMKEDLKNFTGFTKSEKEYQMKEWGMSEETWNIWNGIEE